MATVAAIFDDSVALERAIDRLQKAGLGGDIIDVEEGREADVAPEESTLPGDNYQEGAAIPPLAGGAAGSGVSQTQGTPGLFAGLFGGGVGSDDSGELDRLGEDADAFRLAVERGGKLVVLETQDPDKAVTVLREAGAQQLYDPR